jgi:GNAT superfamily N-acetyltransferase
MTQMTRRARSFLSSNSVPVYFRRPHLCNLPPLWDISPLYVEEMSTGDDTQIEAWLSIINRAFSRNWGRQHFLTSIVSHPVYDVAHTYFLMDDQHYVGVVSEAAFKANRGVGVTHYLGLDTAHLGRGLGKYLILYTLHKMKQHNLVSCEGESTLEHRKSLSIHFDLGFHPKTKPDHWNTPSGSATWMRAIANARLRGMYSQSRARRRREGDAGRR